MYFEIFQALMQIAGYFLGLTFENLVTHIDHWIAFTLLVAIESNMLKEAFANYSENCNDNVDFKTMIVLAIATSIDALVVGITFAFLQVNIWISAAIIGIITLLISIVGVKIGNRFGNKYERKAETVGGLILIFIGVKILLEHLGIFKI